MGGGGGLLSSPVIGVEEQAGQAKPQVSPELFCAALCVHTRLPDTAQTVDIVVYCTLSSTLRDVCGITLMRGGTRAC